MGGHRPAVGIGQRYLAFAAPLQFRQQRPVSPALLAQRRDLFREVFSEPSVAASSASLSSSRRKYSSNRLSHAG